MIFRTVLSSSNFAINSVEGNASYLAKLFPGMSEATAAKVLASRGQCSRPAQDAIDVPAHMCGPEDKGE